jgi:hypothetical protein
MRPTKLALSVLAIAVALGGPIYAANSATPASPAKQATSSTAQTAQANPAPAKHRLLHRRADNKKAQANTSTSSSSTSTTKATGAH